MRLFCKFDGVVAPWFEILGIPIYKFYAAIFRPDYVNVVADSENLFVDGVEIAQWRSGKNLPKRIYNLVLAYPIRMIDRYESDISLLFHEREIDDNTLEALKESLGEYIQQIHPYCIVSNSLKETVPHLCALALVNSLAYDGCIAHGLIATDIKKLLDDAKRECRNRKVAFTNARIIAVLLEKKDSLLWCVLNSVGIASSWKERIDQYILRAEHRDFNEIPSESEWIAISNILARNQGRLRANEADIVRAIIRTSDSKTLNQLKDELLEKGIDQEKWDQKVLHQDDKRSKSSF